MAIESDELTMQLEKMVGDRVNTLVSDKELFAIHQRFGGAIFRRSSVYHGLDRFLRENEVSGDSCFEVGTWNGLTAVILSRYFKHVTTVDIAHNGIKHQIAEFLGRKNIEFIDIDSNADKPQAFRSRSFDFAYLDGDHANDTDFDWRLAKDSGRVLFHECWNFQRPVWELVQSLPKDEVTRGGFGLALWRRKP